MTEFEKLLLALVEDAKNVKEENTEKKDGIRHAAEHTHKLYKTFVDVGFTEEQAFELVKTLLGKEF